MIWSLKCSSTGKQCLPPVTLAGERDPATRISNLPRSGLSGPSAATRRKRELNRVDRELSRGNEKAALTIVKRLQGKPGGLRGFGAAKQVPFKKSSLDQFDLAGVEIPYVSSTVDSIWHLIMKAIQLSFEEEPSSEAKDIALSGDDPLSCETRRLGCAQHEAGHFLVAYLLGILPRGYLVPSMKDIEAQSTRAYVELVDFVSPLEGNNSEVTSKNLNKFSCIALGGLLATYPEYVHTGGFYTDILKVYKSLKWLDFTETETESYMRWAVLNTYQILQRHRVATLRLANAMATAQPVGYCIDVLEDYLSDPV